jgi:hypothetical protein
MRSSDAIIDGRTARTSPRLRPLARHEFPMPAQKRLWRHDQAASAWLRQDSRQRGKEGTIGGAQRGPPFLPAEHHQLMSQYEQLDVLSEFAAAAADQQPQQSREGKIGEGNEHAPMLPSPAIERRGKSKNLAPGPSANGLRSPARSGIARARARQPLNKRNRQSTASAAHRTGILKPLRRSSRNSAQP